MKKISVFAVLITLISCNSPALKEKEELISLFSDSSRLYVENLEDDKSPLLKTYHHKYFGEIPYVELGEYCDTFKESDIKENKNYEIKDEKFIVTGLNDACFAFDAEKDLITSTDNITYFFDKNRRTNNNIPLDFYALFEDTKFIKESDKTKIVCKGVSRTYNCKKYNFDIVYEKGKYYAPFSLLSNVFYGYLNTAFLYNGKNFFDCDGFEMSHSTASYCYSSKGNFLLDRTEGSLGAVLYKKVEPKEKDEVYRFENVIESSGQLTVFSCLKDGTGTLKSYKSDGELINDGTFTKLNHKTNEAKTEIEIEYYSVMEPEDIEPISDTFKLRINLDETYFEKKQRSRIVADFTYQELRFAFYELYGLTQNAVVKDFDNFIKDKEYKNDLLSLDAKTYNDAMAKLLRIGVDDGHTSIRYPSIYDDPTKANANYYYMKYEGPRYAFISNTRLSNIDAREKKKFHEGFEIKNKTAFIAFDSFEYSKNIKKIDEYKDTDPNDYVSGRPMELFASSFNKIKEDTNIENVVIDLSCNKGGSVSTLSYLLAYLTKDPIIHVHYGLNDSVVEFHYLADLDLDGAFGSDLDSFEGKYNFYVLISEASFSCANQFATICKNTGIAKIIGQKSAGGSCIVSLLCNSSGYLYCSSSECDSVLKNGTDFVHNDYGVEPDIKLSPEYYYDHEYIDNLLA